MACPVVVKNTFLCVESLRPEAYRRTRSDQPQSHGRTEEASAPVSVPSIAIDGDNLDDGSGGDDVDGFGTGEPPQQPPLLLVKERVFGVASERYRILWTNSKTIFSTTNRQHISPPIELPWGTFKLMIFPKTAHVPSATRKRHQGSLKKASGKFFVELKCEEASSARASKVTFSIAVGSGRTDREPLRGPVTHDFHSDQALCGLSEDEKDWDLGANVDGQSQSFVVVLDVCAAPIA
jgi:hypothetical protein